MEKRSNYDNTDVLVVGTGYLGRKVAQKCRTSGARVFTTTRRRNRFPELLKAGYHPIQLDWTDRRSLKDLLPSLSESGTLSPSCRVLVAVSYDSRSGLSRYASQVGGLRNLLGTLPHDARLSYISTTGVYHQTDGRWVDEHSPTHPSRLGGRVHLQAEQLLHRLRPFGSWRILRLAGIYGPGRVPRAADVKSGRPIASPPGGYLNLIHVEDAASAVLSSWDHMADHHLDHASMLSRLYCVSDGAPVLRRDFYREIALQCRVEEPKYVAANDKSPVRMRSESNKRVRNRKLITELLPSLEYPCFCDGLTDVLAKH